MTSVPVVALGSIPSLKRSYAFERKPRLKGRGPAPRPCKRCQTVFTPKRENPRKPALYCSTPCRSAAWREEQKKDARIERLEFRISALEEQIVELRKAREE